VPIGVQLEDGKMQVRRVHRRIAGRAGVANQLALGDGLSFSDPVGIALEMVVVAEPAVGIELVDGVAAGFADEQFFRTSRGCSETPGAS
jgi:hypothetical protein